MMSQRNVEKVIGRLVTDEGFRRRFAEDRDAMLQKILDRGLDLNPCERRALLALDPQRIAQFAEQLDPCIQKVELAMRDAPETAAPGATEASPTDGDPGQGDDS